jgi:hypothetical protein
LYKDDIPSKNIKELENFDYSKITKNDEFKCKPFENIPLSEYKYTYGDYLNLYICAPLSSFEVTKNETIVGKEIFKLKKVGYQFGLNPKKEVKDPIILIPVLTKLSQFGFIVITKWGKEADDLDLQVPINN